MKKKIASLILALILLLSTMAMTSCEPSKHTHEWGEWTIEKEPTCTELGKRVRECLGCKDKEKESIPTSPHTSDQWVVDLEPTCESNGARHKVCRECGASYLQDVIYSAHVFENDTCKYCSASVDDFFIFTYSDYYGCYCISGKGIYDTPENIILPQSYRGVKVGHVEDLGFSNLYFLNSVTIPEGYTEIEANAFKGCTMLKRVEIPESLIAIGESAFQNCVNITDVELPKNLTSIGDYAFTECKALQSVTIPEGVLNIPHGAFYKCTALKSVNLHNDVVSIGQSAFSGCSALESIELPENLTHIYSGAFSGCAFTDIVIPDKVEYIGTSAFSSCKELRSVVIGSSVGRIRPLAFSECNLLVSVVFKKTDGWYFENTRDDNYDPTDPVSKRMTPFAIADLENPLRASIFLIQSYRSCVWSRRYFKHFEDPYY